MKNLKIDLARKMLNHHSEVEEWFKVLEKKYPPPFYSSVDIRDSGYKIAPVDNNLFPAGFNNICPHDLRNAVSVFKKSINLNIKKILILPENHTQNRYYIENLYTLWDLMTQAEFEVQIGWYTSDAQGGESVLLESQSGKKLTAYPISIQAGILSANGFTPDMILLNNDFSSGYPEILDTVCQPIFPDHRLGWHSRKKSNHFNHYNELVTEFAQIIEADPWVFQIDTQMVDHVNFNEDQGTDAVAQVVDKILKHSQDELQKHSVNKKPFVYVKNNAGTYGMGIMVVHSADELKAMNRRTKNKMSVGKNKKPIDSVVVQEGIPTSTLISHIAAEPVIYLLGSQLIGGFLRTNTQRGEEDNLNSEGMVFRKLCVSDLRDFSTSDLKSELQLSEDPKEQESYQTPVLELVYGTIARISALAAGKELSEFENNCLSFSKNDSPLLTSSY